MKKDYLEVGRIVSTRGLNGELKVECWCDSPEVMMEISKFYLESGLQSINTKSVRVHKNMVLLKVEGIDSIEDAEKLKGKVLYAHRDDIPKVEGSYFIQDLLGMSIIDVDNGKDYGKLKEIFSTGANDVYTVEGSDKKLYYLPAIKEVVIEIDMDNDKILIRPIEGIFDDDN